MSKKSRWESLRRRALGNTFDGLDVENLSQVVEVLRSDMKWEQMDVLVVNTNYILDAACSRCKSTTRNQAMYAAVARASIQFINEMMILFRPVNMVICSDGALPYGLRRGVRVDNCNSEAFHVAGENWAKGVGWERPYSCADRNLGQAFSPGSMMYSVLDKNILELVQGQMTLQGEGGTSVLYLPHSEIGSWEKKTAALLNIMQVVVDSSESVEEEVRSIKAGMRIDRRSQTTSCAMSCTGRDRRNHFQALAEPVCARCSGIHHQETNQFWRRPEPDPDCKSTQSGRSDQEKFGSDRKWHGEGGFHSILLHVDGKPSVSAPLRLSVRQHREPVEGRSLPAWNGRRLENDKGSMRSLLFQGNSRPS